VPAIPLFTRSELEAAFRLILPAEDAGVTAAHWWDQFADEVDDRGYFLSKDRAGLPRSPPQVVAVDSPLPESEQRERERLFWGSMSTEERIEILMRFSSFHLGLLGLVSDDLHERMRQAEGLTAEQAETRRAQMRGILAAISG
jgi:hypothetical protein